MKKLSCMLIGLLFLVNMSAQTWTAIDNQWIFKHTQDSLLIGAVPDEYQIYRVNFDELQKLLNVEKSGYDILLPIGEEFQIAQLNESKTVSEEVAHLYTIKTFKGVFNGNSAQWVRADISPNAFHGFVNMGAESVAIEPVLKGDPNYYIVYKLKDLGAEKLKCLSDHHLSPKQTDPQAESISTPSNGRTYRLSISATGEYSQEFGGTPYSSTNVLNALATLTNLMNGVYNQDCGVTFTLVSTADVVFPNPSTDPFFPFTDPILTIDTNQTVTDNNIGGSNYDVGHVVAWANTGGVAYLNVVCNSNFKARGFSGASGSITQLAIDYACHELGHQFSAVHNYSSDECGTSNMDYRFEPGEGSSIMAYAGVCGPGPSYQSFSNHFFHGASINDINSYISSSGGCFTAQTTGNSAAPVANANANFTIPQETPFVLVGSATDANDPQANLTYNWSQNDGTTTATIGSPNCSSTTAPMFKFQDALDVPYRILPNYNEVLAGNNNSVDWEKLPCRPRSMEFELVVRDNNSNWGRVDIDYTTVTVANTGPFDVTAPNGGESWEATTTQTISWTVNGTDAHCSDVDILLSTDNGQTWSALLAATPNDGSQQVTLPSTVSTQARVLVQCAAGGTFPAASTFFDLSDQTFEITAALPVEWLGVDAVQKGKGIEVLWSTISETNSEYFEVQKYINGSFVPIGRVSAMGYSRMIQDYFLHDHQPIKGANVYRVKQVDLDESSSFSTMVTLYFDKEVKAVPFIAFPNPFSSELNIQYQGEGSYSIRLLDLHGRQLLQANNPSSIQVGHLPEGHYILKVFSSSGMVQMMRLAKLQ